MKTHSRREFLKAAGSSLVGLGAFSLLPGRKARAAEISRRPNVLLVFPDQLRPDWNSLNPNLPVRTPHLVRLAREGMRFDRAYCPSPLCAPSRACLAQGKVYGRTGVASNGDDNPDGIATFYQGLRDAGYRVGSLGKADLRKAAFDWGPDGLHRVRDRVYFHEWGFTDGFDSEGKLAVVTGLRKAKRRGIPHPELQNPYCRMLAERSDGSLDTYLAWYDEMTDKSRHPNGDYSFTTPCELADPAYNDNWVGTNALSLLEHELPTDRPWFLQVNFPGPHNPQDITRTMSLWYRNAAFPQPVKNNQLTPAIHEEIRRNYSAMVENVDRWLGRFLEALERRGEADTTLVVFSSDHGEMLGDHNRWAKTVPYEPSASVPLVVRGPGVRPGAVHGGVATTLDLPATFLDLAGVPVPAAMDSKSLRPALAGIPGSGRSHVTSALGPWRMVCEERFKLVRGFDPSGHEGGENGARSPEPRDRHVLLFDLEADPTELDNLAERHPEVVARLDPLLPAIPRRYDHTAAQ